MPKLKSALGAYQGDAARRAAAAKHAENKAKMAKEAKHSVAEKRALKRQRRAREEQTRALEAKEAEARARREAAQLATEVGHDSDNDDDEEEEAETDARQAELAAKALARATVAIAPDDTVLLLGEANFSFARALVEGRGHAGHLVCATAYDSEKEALDKYPDAAENVAALRARGARVAFGVDAGALDKSHKVVGKGPRWSRVVFNFPHVGKGITDQDRNVRANQVLLLRTLKSVAPLLTEGPSAFPLPAKGKAKKGPAPKKRPRSPSFSGDEDETIASRPVPASFTPPDRQGTLLVTLLNQPPYSEWELPKLANRPPPTCPGTREAQPRFRVIRSFDFVPAAWPGYAHRRTIGWREGLSKANNEEITGRQGRARTWEMCVYDGE
jgi:25S rRNA (uracil2634-N3)-methyltransferase